MILDLLADIVSRVAGDAIGGIFWELVPRRRRAPREEQRPVKQVVVGAGAMFDRAALYETWANAHGLEWTDARGLEYVGSYRGRRTEMRSGLVDTPLPKSPEILVRVALDGIETTTLLEPRENERALLPPPLRAMAAILEIEGVRDVVVARAFVRMRFDPFVETAVLDAAMVAFDLALESLDASGAPYRNG
jgi:hypothetical protein